MTTSDAINEIADALSKAQGEIAGALKGKENPHFRSKYADLESCWEACRGPLAKHGLSVVQPVGRVDGTLCTMTRISHRSGQWMQDDGIPLLLGKQDMQGLGSALTYSRRYGLMAMVGIAPEDDDGNAASANGNGQAQPVRTTSGPPAGFDAWLDDLHSVADEGTPKLEQTWKASKAEFRSYLTSTNAKLWESIKARAVKATVAA